MDLVRGLHIDLDMNLVANLGIELDMPLCMNLLMHLDMDMGRIWILDEYGAGRASG
jgi:hypothetical protein